MANTTKKFKQSFDEYLQNKLTKYNMSVNIAILQEHFLFKSNFY